MKNLLVPNRRAWLGALLAATPLLATLTPTEWQHRQSLVVPAPGLVRVALTPAAFDAAAPDQRDFRIIDANADEFAYLLDAPSAPRARTIRPESFDVKLDSGTTVLTLATGTKEPIASVSLETPHPFFLRAARVEISDDGSNWTLLDEGLPLFRQWGAEKLELPLGRHAAAQVRITVTDNRATAVPFTGATVKLASAKPPALMPVGAQITSREEFAGETVLTLALDGRHLPLAALELDTQAPLFTRRVTVTIREVRDAVPMERVVGSGTIYRVALDGTPTRSQLEVPFWFTTPTRELLVHIHNGDSPPLPLDGIKVLRQPIDLAFMAPAAGTYQLLSGNPQATAPRYDLAGFSVQLREASANTVVPGELESIPNYHPRESLAVAPLPDVPLVGSPLDTKDWSQRRTIAMQRPGVQELELDLEALARSRPDYADLRVVHEGNQIPYVLELPALARSISLQAASTPDPKRPSVSLWRLQLPQRYARVQQLVLTSSTALFHRNFSIYERINPTTVVSSELEGPIEKGFASGAWSRTPDPGVPETRIFEFPPLDNRVGSGVLWIETDNGDNPAIELGPVQVVYPVVRLIFKTEQTDGFTLVYGNPSANQPHYDLSLVAERLLTAPRNGAKLSDAGANPAASNPFAGLKGGYVFWAALALVVIVLLLVVAKLLPKPPAA